MKSSAFRFSCGELVATPGADALLREHDVAPAKLPARHLSGDWGDVPPADAQANEAALVSGARLLSSYRVGGQTLWLITEAEPREVTTFLLPADY